MFLKNLLYFLSFLINLFSLNLWRCPHFLWCLTLFKANISSKTKQASRMRSWTPVKTVSSTMYILLVNFNCLGSEILAVRLHYSSKFSCLFSEFLSAIISLHLFSSPDPLEQKAPDYVPHRVWLIEHTKAIAEVNIHSYLLPLHFFWNMAMWTRMLDTVGEFLGKAPGACHHI